MKYIQILITVILFALNASAAGAAPEVIDSSSVQNNAWMGEFSQESAINFSGADNAKDCRLEAPDAEWNGTSCVETRQNKVGVSKITDADQQYFVQIGIIGGNIHTCDFAGVMALQNNKLVYQDVIPDQKDICRIEISRENDLVKMAASDSCSEYYCGFGLELTGTDAVFKRSGKGHEINSATAKKQEQE